MNRDRRCVYDFCRSDKGSFTLEAGIWYPLLLILIFSMIGVALFFYQQTVALFISQQSSERAAYMWDQPDACAGAGQLYDNFTVHSFMEVLKGSFGQPSAVLSLPDEAGGGWQGSKGKLACFAPVLSNGTTGVLTYRNRIWERNVRSELEGPSPQLLHTSRLLQRTAVSSSALSHITNPAAWMRIRDMALDYGESLHSRFISPEQAQEALIQFLGRKEPDAFDTERAAAIFLRSIMNGVETERVTSLGVRKIDSLDVNGIAHDAFLTFTVSGLSVQLEKDKEMLRNEPDIKGVVWHFFRRTGQTGKVGPSESFLRELRDGGIAYVIHDR